LQLLKILDDRTFQLDAGIQIDVIYTRFILISKNHSIKFPTMHYLGNCLHILGPVLFLIYIDDLPEFCGVHHKMYLYADDAKLYNTITSKEDQLCLQQVMNRIKKSCDKWLLKLNISKCNTVSYCMKNMTNTEYFINDGRIDHEIEKLANIKDLGVIFDSELSFRDHIQLKNEDR